MADHLPSYATCMFWAVVLPNTQLVIFSIGSPARQRSSKSTEKKPESSTRNYYSSAGLMFFYFTETLNLFIHSHSLFDSICCSFFWKCCSKIFYFLLGHVFQKSGLFSKKEVLNRTIFCLSEFWSNFSVKLFMRMVTLLTTRETGHADRLIYPGCLG